MQDIKSENEYFIQVDAQCNDKKRQWLLTSKDRQAEKAALREAIAFLNQTQNDETTKPGVFVQVPYVHRDVFLAFDDGSFIEVSNRHRRIHRSRAPLSTPPPSGSNGLLTSALVATADAEFSALMTNTDSHQRKEGFNAAVKVVRELILTLQNQQKDEDEKRNYCEKEIATTEDEKSTTKENLDALDANIERKTTQIQIVEGEIAKIKDEDEQAGENDKEAAALRSKEGSAYTGATKDRELAIKMLHQAQMVLKRFYESKTTNDKRHSVQSSGAVAMLEKVAEDIEKEQGDAKKTESSSKTEYDHYVDASKTAFRKRFEAMTTHVTRRARDVVKLNNGNEDLSSQREDHEAIKKQLEGLHDECDQLVQNHEQRQKARSFEISQLRDVVDILSGSSVAARTGLLQKQTGHATDTHPEDQGLAALQTMSSTINGLQLKAQVLANQ